MIFRWDVHGSDYYEYSIRSAENVEYKHVEEDSKSPQSLMARSTSPKDLVEKVQQERDICTIALRAKY